MAQIPSSRRDFLIESIGIAGLATYHFDVNAALPDPAPPDWVWDITRMGYLTPGEVGKAANMGVQVIHTNSVWPYFPLRRDGGGLSQADAKSLRALVDDCRKHKVRLVLGLPPFPSVLNIRKHPDWRVHPDASDAARKVEPREDNLGTRLGCNFGPWGEYFIEVCAELVEDYGIDGYSFDGNYHPPICYCPSCKLAYPKLPAKMDLDDVAYREYLVWRGQRLEDHYRRLRDRLRKVKADAVIMSWTVNAGRYGHFLHSPRAMPTSLNRIFDLPMQEWWLDETNIGASIVPAFGATYLRATVGERPAAAEPYLMSRGNPYGTDSFPVHERRTRCLLALTCGNILAESLGWPGHDVADDFREVAALEPYLIRNERLPWCAMLVSEQTRQFYAYRDIPNRFLPHPLGVFRAASEEHLPLSLLNDWDLTAESLAKYAVLILPNSAAMSEDQIRAVRLFVEAGGGLVALGESSLCDELGRVREDFGLAELFGVSYRGRPSPDGVRPKLDENFARQLDESYWKDRIGVANLTWSDHVMFVDPKLNELVPTKAARFRGPLVRISEPTNKPDVIARLRLDGSAAESLPAMIARSFGKGRVVYSAAGVDAALWSYAYPYQRRLMTRMIEWAARTPSPISVRAPMCVHVTHFTQKTAKGKRIMIHLFNGVNTTAQHGLPSNDVPLREEIIPIHDITITFHCDAPHRFFLEPRRRAVKVVQQGGATIVTLPPLELHAVLVGELS